MRLRIIMRASGLGRAIPATDRSRNQGALRQLLRQRGEGPAHPLPVRLQRARLARALRQVRLLTAPRCVGDLHHTHAARSGERNAFQPGHAVRKQERARRVCVSAGGCAPSPLRTTTARTTGWRSAWGWRGVLLRQRPLLRPPPSPFRPTPRGGRMNKRGETRHRVSSSALATLAARIGLSSGRAARVCARCTVRLCPRHTPRRASRDDNLGARACWRHATRAVGTRGAQSFRPAATAWGAAGAAARAAASGAPHHAPAHAAGRGLDRYVCGGWARYCSLTLGRVQCTRRLALPPNNILYNPDGTCCSSFFLPRCCCLVDAAILFTCKRGFWY